MNLKQKIIEIIQDFYKELWGYKDPSLKCPPELADQILLAIIEALPKEKEVPEYFKHRREFDANSGYNSALKELMSLLKGEDKKN